MEILWQFLSLDPHNHLQILLLLMVVVWGAGRLAKLVGLPPMLGEILSGILIGPSVLGLLGTTEFIKILAELGVFFLMFHSGLDTDLKEFVKRSKISLLIALSGIVLTSSLVLGLNFWFDWHPITVGFLMLILSLNSIPVIVSVLKSFGLRQHRIGHIALGASVVNELLLFIAFSVLMALAQNGGFSFELLGFVLLKVLLFMGVSIIIGAKLLPIIGPLVLNRSGSKGFTFALIIALCFGLLAESIGLHMILGAYLAGLFVRQEITKPEIMRKIEDRFYALSHSFLGPIFFASVGMMIPLGAILEQWSLMLGLLLVVLVGQVGGAWLARLGDRGVTWPEITATGLTLTGRGSTEIIMAQLGFTTVMINTNNLTILNQELFAAIVGLAFVSTLLMPIMVKIFCRWVSLGKV